MQNLLGNSQDIINKFFNAWDQPRELDKINQLTSLLTNDFILKKRIINPDKDGRCYYFPAVFGPKVEVVTFEKLDLLELFSREQIMVYKDASLHCLYGKRQNRILLTSDLTSLAQKNKTTGFLFSFKEIDGELKIFKITEKL